MASDGLVFALNGDRVELKDVDPSSTLIDYLRRDSKYKGTKLGCGEGGCGACTVLISGIDPISNSVKEVTANSCLLPLGSLHLRSVTTTEGLGSQKNGLHPVQERLAGFHGSQCGFCTPGMVMSTYGKVREKQGKGGSCGLSQGEFEGALQGNLCRCTGYRPILDACKSFAGDIDVEDLGLCSFRKDPSTPPELPPYDPAKDPPFPEFLREEAGLFSGRGEGGLWCSAGSLDDLFALLAEHSGKDIKLVVGNTSRGYYKDERPDVYIDIKGIRQLQEIHHREDGLAIGGAVTIADVIGACEEPPPGGKLGGSRPASPFVELAAHMRQVATPQVRHMASVAGNLIIAQQKGFQSDLAPILWAAGATVSVGSGKASWELSVEDFLKQGLGSNEVITGVFVPSVKALSNDGSETVYKTYRAAARRNGNALAHINAAFRAEFANGNGGVENGVGSTPHAATNGADHSPGATPNGVSTPPKTVKEVVLVFGALGELPVRVEKTEAVFRGREPTARLLRKGLEVLRGELGAAGADDFKLEVAGGFLYRFFASFLNGEQPPIPAPLPPSHGRQNFSFPKDHYPVSEPRPKQNVDLQASGEAVYVDDVRAPANLLYAAFVNSTKARAQIKSVDATAALGMPGVVGFLDAKCIPGENCGSRQWGQSEPLFATDKVEFDGQPLGLIVADSPRHAADAARCVHVEYDTSASGPPVLDATQATEFLPWAPFVAGLLPNRGDLDKALAESPRKANGTVRSAEQLHFYMEPQTALAIPDEDGFMTVYSACQGPNTIADAVTVLLGVPKHSVRIITRRVGGAFGGKVTRAQPIAGAAALAARVFNRPVRLTLDRNTDCKMTGGREPMHADYEVGFTEEGKINSLKVKALINCGWNRDMSDVAALDLARGETYMVPNMKMEIIGCKTNLSTKTTMRGPGRPQVALLYETIIEHVAAIVRRPADAVREANLYDWKTLDEHSGGKLGGEARYTLPAVWKSVKESSDYEARAKAVGEFNSEHRWQKRGIAMAPCMFDAMNFPRPSRVSVFADGSIIIDCTGVEMGQGLHTKVLQTAAYALNEPFGGMENGVDFAQIRIVDQDSHGVVNAPVTAGSTGSEACCEAVRRCCAELNKRLRPMMDALKEAADGKPVTWEPLIQKASMSGVHLSAEVLFDGKSEEQEKLAYFVFGAAVSEVELDVLTGGHTIVRSDIVFDAGKSLNPAVDIGQIEGAFVQGIGFFTSEEGVVAADGTKISDGTWTYKIPTADAIPRDFRVELLSGALNDKGVLSSKASGEPPLQLACSVHTALRQAIAAVRSDVLGSDAPFFQLDAPATMPRVKAAIGADVVEKYLKELAGQTVAST